MSKTLEQWMQEIKAGTLSSLAARELHLLESPTYQTLQTLAGHSNWAYALTLPQDGRLASRSDDDLFAGRGRGAAPSTQSAAGSFLKNKHASHYWGQVGTSHCKV